MLLHTFYGGVHPHGFKSATSSKPIKKTKFPQKVVIPLSQHTGTPCEPVVSPGTLVKTGTLVGKAPSYISSPVHASISGKVTKVAHCPHPLLGRALAVVIENDGSIEEKEEFAPRRPDEIRALSREALLECVKNAGIVGLGGAAFPTHVKLSPPKGKKVDTVILNGAECEPFLTCDERLMCEKPEEILRGLGIIIKILEAENAYVAIEDNKPGAANAMEKALSSFRREHEALKVKVVTLTTKYPQGAEKQLIKSILNRVVPAGGLPMDVGCVVHNVGTAYAVYEAVHFGKPLIERCVTIAGPCVAEPTNLLVRIGTLLGDLTGEFGGFREAPERILFGGPMMGLAQYTMDVPIVKGTSGVLFLQRDPGVIVPESVCIRCSKCIEVCPAKLAPTTLANLVKKAKWLEVKDWGVAHCIECGACAYECPAKIPLVDYIKFGKAKLAAHR
jgi:electron transport complex protein RnfC